MIGLAPSEGEIDLTGVADEAGAGDDFSAGLTDFLLGVFLFSSAASCPLDGGRGVSTLLSYGLNASRSWALGASVLVDGLVRSPEDCFLGLSRAANRGLDGGLSAPI